MKDIKSNEIKVGDELDVPTDVFSTGIVVTNNKGELCLELRYEGNLIPIKHMKYLRLVSEVFN